jgi:hypothetical protein
LTLALAALPLAGLCSGTAQAEFILDGTAGTSTLSVLIDLGAGGGTSAPTLNLADPFRPVITLADPSALYVATLGISGLSLDNLANNLIINAATTPDSGGVYHTIGVGLLPDDGLLHFDASTGAAINSTLSDIVPLNRSDFPGSVLGVAFLDGVSAGGLSAEFDLTSSTGALYSFQLHQVPEPAALALASIGSLGVLGLCRRRVRAAGPFRAD